MNNDPVLLYPKQTLETFALLEKGSQIDYSLKVSVSVPTTCNICFSHLEAVEEDTTVLGFTSTCGWFTPHHFLPHKWFFELLLVQIFVSWKFKKKNNFEGLSLC